MSIAVVIPFHKEPDWSLFENLPSDVHIYAVDDSSDSTLKWRLDGRRYTELKSQPEYGRRTSACRNWGHLMAYRDGHDIIMALDSDCRPGSDWVQRHRASIGYEPGWTLTRPRGWLNTIHTHDTSPEWFARGVPYEARDSRDVEQHSKSSGSIKLNMGTWSGVLDINAIDRLAVPKTDADGADGLRVSASMFPICGMNVAFAAELLPAYFFLPDVEVVPGWTMSRHDDIWGGYILKRLMDKKGDLASFGEPVVEHTVLSDRDRALVAEHWFHLLSRGFYACVDEAVAHVKLGSYQEMYAEFVTLFRAAVEVSREPRHYREAYLNLAAYMDNWVAAFS